MSSFVTDRIDQNTMTELKEVSLSNDVVTSGNDDFSYKFPGTNPV